MNKYSVLFLLFIFVCAYAQKSEMGGLRFSSLKSYNSERTSLNLTSNKKIELDKNLTLQFEISLDQNSDYGFVFRIKSESFKINLLYIPYQNKDTSYLQLVINNEVIENKISLPKIELGGGSWFKAILNLDRLDSSYDLSVENKQRIKSKLNFGNSIYCDIIFGVEKLDGLPNGEVPDMSIRNIELLGNKNKPIHLWPLNESSGFIAHDLISNLSANVLNPNWMINNHYKFKNLAAIGPFPKNYPEEALPVIYRSSKNQILIVSKDFYYSYDINTGKIKKEIFTVPLLHKDNVVVYNEKLDRLFAYYRGLGKVFLYDEKSKSWSVVDTTGEHDGNFYFHNPFVNPLNNDLLMINGYGWYTFKNYLQKYDFTKKKWTRLKTKGDFLVPRLAAAFGKKNDQGDFFIFGGFGNKSGKQEEGTKPLNDLYLLRMKDTSIQKIGDLQNIPNNLNAYPTIYFDSSKNQLYFMGNQNYGVKNSFKRIFRYDLTKKTFEPVSDSIKSSDIVNTPTIFDEANKKIFAFERIDASPDSFNINIKSLLFPPLTEREFEELNQQVASTNTFSLKNKLLVALFILITATGIVFYFTHKKLKKLPAELSRENNLVANKQLNINSVYLFGDFQVFDNTGKNISKLFTPKLKQIFLLLIIKSYNGNNHGISTESLTTYIWPELGTDQTKNNRNVTISKLRKILSGLDGVEVINEKNMWEITIAEKVYCDFKEFKNVIGSNDFDIEKINVLKNILARGELLKESSYEWFDGIKTNLIEEAIQKLKIIAAKNNIDNQFKLSVADSILFLDSANEDGLTLKLKSLIEFGDHNLAVATFNAFKKEYFRLYAEEYPKSFSDF